MAEKIEKQEPEQVILTSIQAYKPKTAIGNGATADPLFEKGQEYTLQEVLSKLSARAHKHDLETKVINNCNCNCGGTVTVGNCPGNCCNDCVTSH